MVILDDNENTNQVVEREPEQIYRIGGPVKRPKEVNMSTTELLNLFNDNKPKANTVVVEHAVTAPKVDELNITPSPKTESTTEDIARKQYLQNMAKRAAMSTPEDAEVALGDVFDPDVAINPTVSVKGATVVVPNVEEPVDEDFGDSLFDVEDKVDTTDDKKEMDQSDNAPIESSPVLPTENVDTTTPLIQPDDKEGEKVDTVPETTKYETPVDKDESELDSKPIEYFEEEVKKESTSETIEEDGLNLTILTEEDHKKVDTESKNTPFNNEMFSQSDLKLISEQGTPPIVVPLQRQEVIKASVFTSNPKIMRSLASEEDDGDMRDKLSNFANKLDEVISNENSYLHRLHYADLTSGNSAQLEKTAALDSLFAGENKNKTSKDFENGVTIDNVRYTDGVVKKDSVLRSFKDGDVVSSKRSLQVIMALMQGIRKVHFYGSGFWVAIRAPMLGELQQLQNDVNFSSGEYGRNLGGFTYLPETVEVSTNVVKLFHSLIMKSNLQGYEDLETFKKALSFVDYDIIPWAMATLMYPKGVELEFICHNKDCRYTEHSRVDLDRMRFNNWSLLSSDAIKFTVSSEMRSLEDVEEYRTKYLSKNEKVVKLTNNDWVVNLQVPTFAEYEVNARNYIGEMMKTITDIKTTKTEDYQAANYFKTFVPFVRNVKYSDMNSGKSIIFNNSSNLAAALDTLQMQSLDVDLASEITIFLGATKISHICYTYNACPKCGVHQTAGVNDLIACDPEMTFFILAANRAIADRK